LSISPSAHPTTITSAKTLRASYTKARQPTYRFHPDPKVTKAVLTVVTKVTSGRHAASTVDVKPLRRHSARAVSEVIAALMLIAIAVSAAVLLYVFSIGLLGNFAGGGGEQASDQVIMEAYNFQLSTLLTVTFKNVGISAIDMSHADYFLNGAPATPGNGCQLMLAISQSCSTTLSVANANLASGMSYPLRVVSPDGGMFAYSVTYGSSG